MAGGSIGLYCSVGTQGGLQEKPPRWGGLHGRLCLADGALAVEADGGCSVSYIYMKVYTHSNIIYIHI